MTTSSPPCQKSSLRTLAQLLPFLKSYRYEFILASIALLVAASTALSLPVAFRQMMDKGFVNPAHHAGEMDRYFFILFGISCLLGVATAARFYIVSWLGERITADIRKAVYARILTQSLTFFETTKTGEVLSRLTTDTMLIQTLIGTSISMSLRNALLLLGSMLMLFVSSPKLASMTLIMLGLVVLPIVWVARRVRALSRHSQDQVANTSGLAGEVLNAITTVQAYTHESIESQRFAVSAENAFHTAIQRNRVRALLTVMAIVLVFGAIIYVLWLGASTLMHGQMTSGELGQFVMYAAMVATSIGALAEIMGNIHRAAGATGRLLELLDAQPVIVSPASPVACPLSSASGATLVLRDVHFHYPSRSDKAALSHLSLNVMPGETVAIVGPSGAGKTTLFQLLLRFYDPQQGQIMLEGIDIRQLALNTLRDAIGIVPQETIIFSANAMENIRYGRHTASDAQVIAAAHMAAASDFIECLPQGYHTFLGERGMRLSGGQRQRIAIARALLKNPPLLLLDEATNALDATSEKAIQHALEVATTGRTTLVIAHRLATVQRANKIIVLDHGHLVETGTHNTLIAQNGLYAHLAALQFNPCASLAPT